MKYNIKDYIEFAIKNDFNVRDYCLTSDNVKNWAKKWFEATATVSDIEMITCLKFIEAIARGIEWKYIKFWDEPTNEDWNRLKNQIDNITRDQAFAIRDDTLIEYINNVMTND